jgi:hypothetical protein
MQMGKTFQAATTILTHHGQTARITVPDGFRAVLLMRGERPWVVPLDEPGEYDVSTDLLSPDTTFPTAIVVLDVAHLEAWEDMTDKQVGVILDRCTRICSDGPS